MRNGARNTGEWRSFKVITYFRYLYNYYMVTGILCASNRLYGDENYYY